MQISVVIPIFNEHENLEPLRTKLRETLDAMDHSYEVIFVNDGSSDASADILDGFAAENSNFKVIHFRRNFGQTAAMMAGIDHAQGDIVVPMDGDLQNDPKDIPRLLAKLEQGFDVVSGWRKNRQDNAVTRNFPSRMANRLISLISGVKLNDYGCSLKAYRRSILKDVRLYGEMHRFIPVYASWVGAKVTELPVEHHARQFGTSNYGMERTIKVLLDLIVLKFRASYAQKPIYFFGGFGLLCWLGAAMTFVAMLVFKWHPNPAWQKDLVETPLPSLLIMLFLMGFMAILMGLLADIQMRTYYESQGKSIYHVQATRNVGGDHDDKPNPTAAQKLIAQATAAAAGTVDKPAKESADEAASKPNSESPPVENG